MSATQTNSLPCLQIECGVCGSRSEAADITRDLLAAARSAVEAIRVYQARGSRSDRERLNVVYCRLEEAVRQAERAQ